MRARKLRQRAAADSKRKLWLCEKMSAHRDDRRGMREEQNVLVMAHVRSCVNLVDQTDENVGHPGVDAFHVFSLARWEPDRVPGMINFHSIPGWTDLG